MNYFKLFIITIALSIMASCSQEQNDPILCGTVTWQDSYLTANSQTYFLWIDGTRIQVSEETYLNYWLNDPICIELK